MTAMSRNGQGLEVESLPPELESAQAKLVYLCLRAGGGRTVDELQVETGLSKLTLHSLLRTMERDELVRKTGETYVVREPAQ